MLNVLKTMAEDAMKPFIFAIVLSVAAFLGYLLVAPLLYFSSQNTLNIGAVSASAGIFLWILVFSALVSYWYYEAKRRTAKRDEKQ